jgi:hypothetical protein
MNVAKLKFYYCGQKRGKILVENLRLNFIPSKILFNELIDFFKDFRK